MKLRLAVASVLAGAGILVAQDIISAKAGYLNYQQGRPRSERRQLQEGENFVAESGRTEILLTPGTFLRLDRQAEINLISSSLVHPAVELIAGTVNLEIAEVPKDGRIAMRWREKTFLFNKKGLFRFDASGERLMLSVYDGKVELPGYVTLTKGRQVEVSPDGYSAVAKFDRKAFDSFDLWASARTYQLSAASMRSASTYSGRQRSSIWAYNAFLGGYTYLPYSYWSSFWGYPYYSPRTVWVYVQPPYSVNVGGWSQPRGFSGRGSGVPSGGISSSGGSLGGIPLVGGSSGGGSAPPMSTGRPSPHTPSPSTGSRPVQQ
jgi:hypothetical protein